MKKMSKAERKKKHIRFLQKVLEIRKQNVVHLKKMVADEKGSLNLMLKG